MKKATLLLLATILILVSISIAGGLEVPNSNIKTVEFLVGQNRSITTIATGVPMRFDFKFNIPENSPVVRYAWIELMGISSAAADTIVSINLDGFGKNAFSIDGSGETAMFKLRYPFYPEIKTGLNGPYRLVVTNTGGSTAYLSAKLVLTYEYDSTSPLHVKTVRYFINQTYNTHATAVPARIPGRIYIPESNINITSAFVEIVSVNNGVATYTITAGMTNNTAASNYFSGVMAGTAATQSTVILYNMSQIYTLKKGGYYNFTLNVTGTGTSAVTSTIGTSAVVTYEYMPSQETNQLNTVSYLIASGNTSVLSGVQRKYNFSVPIAENITVVSAFIRYSAWSGAAITAVTTTADINITGANGKTLHTMTTVGEGSNFVLFYNATNLYNMTGNRTEGPYQFNSMVTATGHTNTLDMAELWLTYNFSTAVSKLLTKTVQYAGYNSKTVSAGAQPGFDNVFFVITPENNITAQSVYLEASSVSLGTTSPTFNISIGTQFTTYTQSVTGETTFNYFFHNLNNSVYNISKGLNGHYIATFLSNQVDSVMGGKVIATYFFRP